MDALSRTETNDTVLFASAVSGAGKTACAVHFARSLAREGLRTILIDFDSASSCDDRFLHAHLAGAPGIAEVMAGHKGWRDVLHEVGGEKWSYIPAGQRTANLADLLARGAFGTCLREIRTEFERVVVSGSPLLEGNDTVLLLAQVQAVCLVLRPQKSSRRVAARAIRMLRQAGAPPRWLVFDREGVATVIRRRK